MKLTKTTVPTLYRTEAGTYVMRAKINGQIVQKKLETQNFAIAKKKLPTIHAEEAERLQRKREEDDCATMGALIEKWLAKDALSKEVKQSTKDYHAECVKMIRKTWKELDAMNPRSTSPRDCLDWADRHRQKYSATRYNGSVDVLRSVFEMAQSIGLRSDNPAARIEKASVKQKELKLPSHEKFTKMLAIADDGKIRQEVSVAMRFLAFSGMRINEARQVTLDMVDFQNEVFHLPESITKRGSRDVPIIPELMPLVKRLCADIEADGNQKYLLPTKDCRRALKTLCGMVGTSKITNHDLRHLFATRCIESGVDIPTVARWLGHKDGGALAMKTYGHLRDEHSRAMAKKVKFG